MRCAILRHIRDASGVAELGASRKVLGVLRQRRGESVGEFEVRVERVRIGLMSNPGENPVPGATIHRQVEVEMTEELDTPEPRVAPKVESGRRIQRIYSPEEITNSKGWLSITLSAGGGVGDQQAVHDCVMRRPNSSGMVRFTFKAAPKFLAQEPKHIIERFCHHVGAMGCLMAAVDEPAVVLVNQVVYTHETIRDGVNAYLDGLEQRPAPLPGP